MDARLARCTSTTWGRCQASSRSSTRGFADDVDESQRLGSLDTERDELGVLVVCVSQLSQATWQNSGAKARFTFYITRDDEVARHP